MKTNKLSCWLARSLLLAITTSGASSAIAIDIFVGNTADSGNGTLRQAIQFNDSLGGGNTILFSNNVTGTITLTNPLGELLITKDVTIIGPGSKVLTINGNHSSRVFHTVNPANASISGLTITNGTVPSDRGGGIFQEGGSLTLSNCVVINNQADSRAGGIYFQGGVGKVINCTITGNNSATSPSSGGGGIFVDSVGSLQVVNCSIFGNIAAYGGGAAVVGGSTAAFTNCTISGNQAVDDTGGGVFSDGTVLVRNTIIAANTTFVFEEISKDCYGTFSSQGFNLIGEFNGSTGWGALGDQIGTTNSPINPLLGPLQDNGGLTPTMAPRIGSPAIDQGNAGGITTDQRGRARPGTNDYVVSIPLGGNRSDIGAVELNPASLVVSNNNDSGSGSLRQVIQSAAPVEGDVISFASNVVGNISLTTGELLITKSLFIRGPAITPLTISGSSPNRVMHFLSNSIVSISSLTIANGNYPGDGGGILSEFGCTLNLNNCAVIANLSGGNGGALANNGSFNAYNCTFTSNRANFTGGAIYTFAGPVVLRDCTVVSNTAISSAGGGLCNYSLQAGTSNYLTSTLVAGNTANGHADVVGVFTSGGYNLIGQIDYTTPASGPVAGVPTRGLTNGVKNDQVGSAGTPIAPKVGPLRNNGGPTSTMALLSNSPAIDKGINNALSTDQRGAPRPFDFVSLPNASGGDGSDIGAFELGSPTLVIQQSTTNAIVSWPAYYGDFSLQSITNLALTNWITVPGTPVVVANLYNVTNGQTTDYKFYRLKSN